MARKADRRIISLFESMAKKTPRWRVGCRVLAARVRRTRRKPDGAIHFLGRDGPCGSAADGELSWSWADRADDYFVRNGSAEEAVHPQNSQRRGNLVPGFFGTE